MPKILEHKNKLFTISDKSEGKFFVIKASSLPNGKKLVEEIRSVNATSEVVVERLIRENKYSSFDTI